MKHAMLILALMMAAAGVWADDAAAGGGSNPRNNEGAPFRLGRGIGILEWETLPLFFKSGALVEKPAGRRWLGIPESFERFGPRLGTEFGFDHIRFMIFEAYYFDEAGQPRAEAFEEFAYLAARCREWGLRIVVVPATLRLHRNIDRDGSASFWTEEGRAHFRDFWRRLASELRRWPASEVAFDLLNEPVAPDPELWNLALEAGLQGIREADRERTVFVPSNHYSDAGSVPALRVPPDPRVVLTFHCYQPMLFTHYRVPWVRMGAHDGGVRYPGLPVGEAVYRDLRAKNVCQENDYRVFDKEALREILLPAVRKARELSLPLHCGEFGCSRHAPREDRERYLRDMISLFDEYGIAWTVFDLQSDLFGLLDANGGVTASLPAGPAR
jgi:endoglucanase